MRNENQSGPLRPSPLVLADLIGKSFQYGGRGPFEYDCYGLVMEIYKRRGMELPDFGSSPSASWIHRVIMEQTQCGVRNAECGVKFIQITNPEPFCLVTFMIRPPYTSHVGVVLENGYQFIHIMAKLEVTIERLDGMQWKRRITGFFKPEFNRGDAEAQRNQVF
jgi:cell wall-associated NlpC family hydrolase